MKNLIGQSLGRYRLIEPLGEGGMALVFKGYDTRLERDVAVKVIRSEFIQLEDFIKRFEREAKALAQLTHPNIVHINDFGEHEGVPYLVMDYLPGGTLKEQLNQPVPFQKALKLLKPVAQALDYAHEMKIIHRDIKPANILLTANGQPMLTDFGLAKILEANTGMTLTGTGVGIGTPDYMAPEQWLGKTVPATDIYALGIVFYEMITGRRPYTADTPAAVLLKQANEPLPRPSSFVNDIPEGVEQFLYKTLAKEPKNRFENMGEMVNAMEKLERYADTLQIFPPEETSFESMVLLDTSQEFTQASSSTSKSKPEPQPEKALDKNTKSSLLRKPLFWFIASVCLILCVLGGLLILKRGADNTTQTAVEQNPPPEPSNILYEDDFENAQFNDSFNDSLWDFWGGTLISAYQQEGSMQFTAPAAENEGAHFYAQQAKLVNELNFFQADINLSYYDNTGFGTASFAISPDSREIWIECEFITDGDELFCAEKNGQKNDVIFVNGIEFREDQWYTLTFSIEPQSFEVKVYLDDMLIGQHIPNNTKMWKESPLYLQYGVYAYRTISEVFVDFDNLRTGSQFAPKTQTDEPPLPQTINEQIILLEKFDLEPILKDDFEDKKYEGSFNQSQWDTSESSGTILQESGKLHFLIPPVSEDFLSIFSNEFWSSEQANYFSVFTAFEEPNHQGNGYLMLSLSDAEWRQQIDFTLTNDGYWNVMVYDDSEEPVFEKSGVYDPKIPNQMEIHLNPQNMRFAFLLNHVPKAAYTPVDPQNWKNTALQISLNAYVEDPQAAFKGSFDNVLAGKLVKMLP